MTKKSISIILLLISVMIIVVLYQTEEVSMASHGRSVSSIKENSTERPPSWYMDNSSNRFGVNHDKITPLNLGMTLPTDFSFNGSDWEIATLNAIFIVQEAGSRKQEAGSRKQEAGSRKQEAGSRKQEAGSRKQEAGSRKQEAGSIT